MMRTGIAPLAPALAAGVLAAGCASTGHQPAPIDYVHGAPQRNSAPPVALPAPSTAYATAPGAPVPVELAVCNFSGSNLGPLDERGVSLAYTPWILADGVPLIRNPTEGACLSSGYGYRERAIGGGKSHTGIDLANPSGGYIFAAGDARVAAMGWRGDYGLTIELEHSRDVRTLYAHLSEIDPNLMVGGRINGGQAMARMGATGNATGVHLHYELTVDGQKVDPLTYGPAAPVS